MAKKYIGLDIGGTFIKGIIATETGKVLTKAKYPTEDRVIHSIIEICSILLQNLELNPADITGLGIGAAGSIDKKAGMIITSPNIPSWKNYSLVKEVEKNLGIKTYLENDATAAVLGEHWLGAGKDYKNWLMLTLGTGIGGGIVIDNKVYTGRNDCAGEIGHMSIDPFGKSCACGNKGCFELYGSAIALERLAVKKLREDTTSSLHQRMLTEKLTAKMVQEEAEKGDKLSLEIYETTGTYLGIGITNLINIFNPEAIFLAGGLSHGLHLLLPAIEDTINQRAMDGLKENVKILKITNEDESPALGAIYNIILQNSASA